LSTFCFEAPPGKTGTAHKQLPFNLFSSKKGEETLQEQLIAPCGMNCALCVSYRFMADDLNRHGFHKRYCPGCIPRGKHCTFMANSCERVGKGRVRFCFECPDYPCKRLKALDKRYHEKYDMSMIENLESIKTNGMESFLNSQQEKWRCPACGGVICCHNGLCLTCDIEKLKNEKNTVKLNGNPSSRCL
jgi:hypothetical protein